MRIQRKRTKGFRTPKNTVFAGRPSKWGNPFVLEKGKIYIVGKGSKVFLCEGDIDKVLRLYESCLTGYMVHGEYHIEADRLQLLLPLVRRMKKLNLSELKGKNISCWCPLDSPCHVDVIIKHVQKSK